MVQNSITPSRALWKPVSKFELRMDIVLILSITLAPMNAGILVLFLFGTFGLILGMGLFTIGSEISMKPLGEAIGTVPGKCQDRRSHGRYGHSRPCRAGGRV